MRIRGWWPAALPAVVLFFSVSSYAQFQPPTEEELKMTSEPKAPGVSAIYLYREETTDDNLHYSSVLVRIKVLSEKGKELATVSVPYPKGSFKVTDIKGRTIHSDGTIFPLDVKPTDLVDSKLPGFQLNKMVFTLPKAEVGSILEYRWEIRYDDNRLSSPDWEVQQPYFVRKAHYTFLPYKFLDRVVDNRGDSANKLLYSTLLPKGYAVAYEDTSKKYKLDIADVPPIPDEEYMPPFSTFVAQVHFYYTSYTSKEDYWKHEGSRWSKQIDSFANETQTLKDAVRGIITPGDSEDVKAQKIYDAVMALDNTDYTRKKSSVELKHLGMKQAKNAEDVWKQKGGSSDEIAELYLALARSAGLKAYALRVSNRNRVIFNPFFLSTYQLDDVLVIVSIGGKETVLDPGSKMTAFGMLAWKHNLAGGLRQSDKGIQIVGTASNPYKDAATVRTADITLDRTGAVTGFARISMNGPAALHWRHLAIENDPEELKKRFNESLRHQIPDGVEAELDHFLALDDFHAQLMAVVKVTGNIGTATGKRVFLPGVFFESSATHPFVAQEKRIAPVDMSYADVVRDEVVYHLPEGFTVESTPAVTEIPWPNHAAFQLKSNVKNNTVTVSRIIAKNFTVLSPEEYKDVHDFYQKVAAADQQQLVLTVASPAKAGN
jgi:transglutaminase-like putative cysteine protease